MKNNSHSGKIEGLIKRGKETLKEDAGKSVDKRDHRMWRTNYVR